MHCNDYMYIMTEIEYATNAFKSKWLILYHPAILFQFQNQDLSLYERNSTNPYCGDYAPLEV